jgi:hypothetical protein
MLAPDEKDWRIAELERARDDLAGRIAAVARMLHRGACRWCKAEGLAVFVSKRGEPAWAGHVCLQHLRPLQEKAARQGRLIERLSDEVARAITEELGL